MYRSALWTCVCLGTKFRRQSVNVVNGGACRLLAVDKRLELQSAEFLPHVCWSLVAVHLEVEPTGITHRTAQGVSPPEGRLGGLAVGATRVGPNHHLAAVILRKYFSLRKYFNHGKYFSNSLERLPLITHQLGSIERGEAWAEERKHHVGATVGLGVLILIVWVRRGVE